MKGQASLEFLSTYGWAFVIIMIMIAAVSYFGVSQPDIFISEKCSLGQDLLCDDYLLTQTDEEGVLLISMRQTVGRSVFLQDVTCSDDVGSQSLGYLHFANDAYGDKSKPFVGLDPNHEFRQWDPAERVTVKCLLSNQGNSPFLGREGDSVRIPVSVIVKKRADGFNHEYQGEIIARVQ